MTRETWENLRRANALRLVRARAVGNWKEVARITEDDIKLNNELLEAEKAGEGDE